MNTTTTGTSVNTVLSNMNLTTTVNLVVASSLSKMNLRTAVECHKIVTAATSKMNLRIVDDNQKCYLSYVKDGFEKNC